MTRNYRSLSGGCAAAAALLLISGATHAGALSQQPCSDNVIRQVSLASKELKDSVIATRCKAWPFRPGSNIAAVAYQTSEDNPEQGGRGIDVVVALLDNTGKVAGYHKIDASEDSGTKFDEESEATMVLDTARYDLADGQRAFGLRLNESAGPACADGYANNDFYLFLPGTSGLQQVLGGLPLSYGRVVKGSPCGDKPDAVVWKEAQLTVTVEPLSSQGFHDLSLSTRTTAGGHSFSYVLHFNGKEYPTQGLSNKLDQFLR